MEIDLILMWEKCHIKTQEGMMQLTVESGIKQMTSDKSLSLYILIQQKFLPENDKNTSRFRHIILAQGIVLIRVNDRRILYGYVSAMMMRPPDWPYSFGAMREAPNLISKKTFS